MKTLKTEITINASKEQVWNKLMDHSNYNTWNPFIKQISGSPEVGQQINVNMQLEGKKPMKFTPLVLKNEKEKEFRWKGKLFVDGLFDGEHFFILENLGNGQTRFVQGEFFTGLLSGVLVKMIGSETKKGFVAMNEALKMVAER